MNIIIGSGPCATNAALILLEKGKHVEIWDIGKNEILDQSSNSNLTDFKKNNFENTLNLYYGKNLEGLKNLTSEDYFDYPASRSFFLNEDEKNQFFIENQFNLTVSHNSGGLSNGWGANFIHFNEEDLLKWPLSFSDLKPYYKKIYENIPITDADDDISSILEFSGTEHSLKKNELDKYIIELYQKKKSYFKNKFILGEARMAIKNHSKKDKYSCNNCGRCVWGCPNHSIYNANETLEKCKKYKKFIYKEHRYVKNLIVKNNLIIGIRYYDKKLKSNFNSFIKANYVLAAGAISSGRIYLETIRKSAYKNNIDLKLPLMDKSVSKHLYFSPNLNLRHNFNKSNFQFNRLIASYNNDIKNWPKNLHLELLNLNYLNYYKLIDKIKLPTYLAKEFFYFFKNNVGAASVFFPDEIISNNYIKLSKSSEKIEFEYTNSENKISFMKKTNFKIKKFLRKLNCFVFNQENYKPGSGIHYAGTLTMKDENFVNKFGNSKLFANLYIADASIFPTLPSKPITFNAVALAMKVADEIK